jgi:peptidoglycan/xylan/chitin deacetylase (PgdA/CDA1 family)
MNPLNLAVNGFGRVLHMTRGARLSILIFHRVLPKPDPLLAGEPDATAFAARMQWLAATFRIYPLIEAARRLRDGTLPPNAACITFDDGYADNATIAAPILARLRLNATFFVSTGFLDGGRMWNDTVRESIRACRSEILDLAAIDCGTWSLANDTARVAAITGLLDKLKYLAQPERQAKVDAIADAVGLSPKSDLMMTRQQVRELRRYGMSIGAHTVTHPILTTLDIAAARVEIADGRRDLEETLNERVRLFAYPNGKPGRDYDASHVAMVREMGFDAAVSTAWGVSRRRTDTFQLARFTPWDATVNRFGMRLAQNLTRVSEMVAGRPGRA